MEFGYRRLQLSECLRVLVLLFPEVFDDITVGALTQPELWKYLHLEIEVPLAKSPRPHDEQLAASGEVLDRVTELRSGLPVAPFGADEIINNFPHDLLP